MKKLLLIFCLCLSSCNFYYKDVKADSLGNKYNPECYFVSVYIFDNLKIIHSWYLTPVSIYDLDSTLKRQNLICDTLLTKLIK